MESIIFKPYRFSNHQLDSCSIHTVLCDTITQHSSHVIHRCSLFRSLLTASALLALGWTCQIMTFTCIVNWNNDEAKWRSEVKKWSEVKVNEWMTTWRDVKVERKWKGRKKRAQQRKQEIISVFWSFVSMRILCQKIRNDDGPKFIRWKIKLWTSIWIGIDLEFKQER